MIDQIKKAKPEELNDILLAVWPATGRFFRIGRSVPYRLKSLWIRMNSWTGSSPRWKQ